MAFLWMDSFDHYSVVTDKYESNGGGASIQSTPSFVRTGIGSMQVVAAFGATKLLPSHPTNLLMADAFYTASHGYVYCFGNNGIPGGTGAGSASCVTLILNPDGSLSVLRGTDLGSTGGPAILGTSAPGIFAFSTFNLLGLQATYAVNAIVNLWVNGVLALALTGVNTTSSVFPGNPFFNAFQMLSPGGLPNCFHDDLYVLDCNVAPFQTYLGPLRIYAGPPSANGAVAWTPLASTNWVEVSEVPPDNDTSYNSSPNVGDLDQYVYQVPAGIAPGAAILAVAHDLDMEVDSGTRSVGSVLNGNAPQNPIALSAGYHIYQTIYGNPAPSFPANLGPKVTL